MSEPKIEHDVILQVLLRKTADGYEAHCLPMDIVTEASSIDAAVDNMCDLIRAQYLYGRDTGNLGAVFVPAQPEEWRKLAHAKPIGSLRSIDLSGHSEHCPNDDDDAPSYALQELEVASV